MGGYLVSRKQQKKMTRPEWIAKLQSSVDRVEAKLREEKRLRQWAMQLAKEVNRERK